MWYLIFKLSLILNILGFIYPFLIKFDVRFNILKLKGSVIITIFNKIKLELKIRIKNGYIYINHKNKLRKEKISEKNIKFIFIIKLIKHLYFRQQFLQLNLKSNFGYMMDSRITAVTSGYIDVASKGIFAKIKNNKKSSHIFVDVEPKYNEDIFNIRLINVVRMSVFDIIYSLILTILNIWRGYEKNRGFRSI